MHCSSVAYHCNPCMSLLYLIRRIRVVVKPSLPSKMLCRMAARPSVGTAVSTRSLECRNRTRAVQCHAQQQQQGVLDQAAARLAGIAQASAVAATLLAAPVGLQGQPADAKTRLSSEEQKVVDLFNKSTSSVVNVTNLSSRCDSLPNSP